MDTGYIATTIPVKGIDPGKTKPGRATDTPSAYELRAIQALNSDRNRRFAEINRGPAAGRSQMVHEALSQCPSRFDLCRKSSRIFRLIHDKNTDRFPTTITKALKWIAAQEQKPAARKPATPAQPRPADMGLVKGAD